MRKLITVIALWICLPAFSQMEVSNNCRADIALIKKALIENKNSVSDDLRARFPIYAIDGAEFLSILTKVSSEFDSGLLKSEGILVGSKVSNIVSLKYPIAQLENIYEIPHVNYLQVAGRINPNLNKVVFDTRADSVHRGLGLPASYTGKDVLIGVTDWGFDYTHPMFYDTLLEQTRILAAWDQFKTSGPHPDGYDYGTEYSTPEELLAGEVDTANIYSYSTHGTHVAGIAGGSGAGTPFRGIGFESQFLFTTFLADEGAVLDAWEWMYSKAQDEGKRLVVNMSWGLYHTGALDGTSILSEALDNYSDLGVVFVTSNGNNGSVDFHIRKEFAGDTLLSRAKFYAGDVPNLWGQSLHAWGEPDQSFLGGFRVLNGSNVFMIETPWYNTETTDTYVDSFLVVPATTDTIFYNLSMDDTYPSNDRPQMRLRVKSPPSGYKIVMKAAASEGIVHFWNVTELSTDVGNWGMEFESLGPDYTAGDNLYGIGAPACTDKAISVAAHAAQFLTGGGTLAGGPRAGFSSIGPLMTDSLKPDISGPGVSVASSISSFTDASYTEAVSVSFEGRDYPFARLSGTSMSSPVVAGVVALMLEANPYLSPWQVKLILIATAREDEHTGVIPADGSTYWGWGKVNAYAAIQMALATTGWTEVEQDVAWTLYPNPAESQLNIKNLTGTVQAIQIFDLSGKLCSEYQQQTTLDINHLTPGTYLIRITQENRVEQQKFIVQ